MLTTIARRVAVSFLVLPLLVIAAGAFDDDDLKRNMEVGPWTVAVNLGPIVNSGFADAGPSISRDGLAMYFHSARHSAGVETDLYVTHRAAVDLPWERPVNLGSAVNSAAPEVAPQITPDGHYLLFASLRSGNYDIYVSHRQDIRDDSAWEPAVPLPAPINGPSFDAGAFYFESPIGAPQLYFSSDRANGLGAPGLDIYMTELAKDGSWTTALPVAELNSPFQDNRLVLRADGLEAIFTSGRDGNLHLCSSTRRHVWEPWSTPEGLPVPVNSDSFETQPTLSANAQTLYFASLRSGGSGNFDLYAATRTVTKKDGE